MKVALDLHDFSILNNRLDLLLKIKEHYPDFKVSLFTVPFDVQYEVNTQAIIHREAALKKIKECLDWIQIIPHGLTHMTNEFEKCDYKLFKDKVMPSIKEAFDKDGLPFVKGFCAPYWIWNKDVIRALDEEGWWGAIDRNQPDMLSPKRFYVYSHSLDEKYYLSNLDTIKLHGHIGSTDNDLEKCFVNIFRLPVDTKWCYATDFIETK